MDKRLAYLFAKGRVENSVGTIFFIEVHGTPKDASELDIFSKEYCSMR
jgi:hypothetical protein